MKVVVFSGGTATNSLTPCFNKLCLDELDDGKLTYVLPISDNGGSTSEILRMFGGPAIGDIRSRIVRLINDKPLQNFFSYRLSNNENLAKIEWSQIVDGHSSVWDEISSELKELVRSFLISIHAQILKKSKSSKNSFDFAKASIGNLFLASIINFVGGSLDSSIELMMRIGLCHKDLDVIPCINTSHSHHISAILKNGDIIIGQSQISHPSPSALSTHTSKLTLSSYGIEADHDHEDYGHPIYILPELKKSQLHFEKISDNDDLPASIEKVFYINPYGEEIKPNGNSRVIRKIVESDMLIYSIGSVMTSLMPIIILGNIAESIYLKDSNKTKKVLLVNNKFDRETFGFNSYTYVEFIVNSMKNSLMDYNSKKALPIPLTNMSWTSFITDIVYLSKGEIQLNPKEFEPHGIKLHEINSEKLENDHLADTLLHIYQE